MNIGDPLGLLFCFKNFDLNFKENTYYGFEANRDKHTWRIWID